MWPFLFVSQWEQAGQRKRISHWLTLS
jgi:hypothetical protein